MKPNKELSDTAEEDYKVIIKIAKKLAPRYVFGSYERADIEQEAIIMGLDGLSRYDRARPLENFLFTHINNRLKNFKRDNYYRITTGNAEKVQQAKKNLLEASVAMDPIVYVEHDIDHALDTKEIIDKINNNLPAKYRQDYLRMCSNVRISKKRKDELISVIKSIVNQGGPE